MQNIQEVFNRIQAMKKEQKDLRQSYKDALSNTQEYVQLQDEMKTMRERKKQIETAIKEQCGSELTKAEDLKIDIESDMELLSDIAMTKVMKGEMIELEDEHGNNYEPIFKVNFKKSA